MYDEDEAKSLLSRTLSLLRESDETLLSIANSTGLPLYWLQKMRRSELRNPSVNRVQHLYEYLSGETIC